MTEVELAQLLTRIQTIDNRTTDRLTLEAWQPIIGNLDYEDAVRAVAEHYGTTGDWLMPHHLVTLASKYDDERAREARRLMEQGTTSVSAGKPPWMAEAEAAARAATQVCVDRGLSRSHPTTKRSALAAANEVQDLWEAEHGAWNIVGRTVVEEEPLW